MKRAVPKRDACFRRHDGFVGFSPLLVMAGRVPAIFFSLRKRMPGTSPGMTREKYCVFGLRLRDALSYKAAPPFDNGLRKMSRSRRKTPIRGITLSDSERDDKQLAAHRERSWVRDRLSPATASDPDFDLPDCDHPHSGRWHFAKDGKYWFLDSKWCDPAKLMRK